MKVIVMARAVINPPAEFVEEASNYGAITREQLIESTQEVISKYFLRGFTSGEVESQEVKVIIRDASPVCDGKSKVDLEKYAALTCDNCQGKDFDTQGAQIAREYEMGD
ncbi:hypothetical protein [Paenibacillus sp. BK720]|uniref:hypothetical protein n=1 Tax=Paenibacillus sp. BK720 TaxID=2587092 RepID=UPI001421CEB1|nr:hypothetical protein [Paenibacillus sp. BK720]NIK67918.1 hypothetical protein [Paenibacillus sp. BK720]